MQVAQRFGGFSLGKADILRRAMGKKNAVEMHKMEEEFVSGAMKLGHSEKKAKEVFAIMEKFAGYGFNRSHAYAYSALAFQLAYFKAHYPEVFFDVLLNYSSSDYITDALHSGFKVAPLTINTVPYRDKFEENQIFLGLKNIKGLPRDLAYWIIEERPFTGIEDFLLRLPSQYRKDSFLIPLIQIGLFDSFEPNRQKIISNLTNLFIFVEELGSLFADSSYSWTEAEDYSQAEKFELEQSILGVGLSDHPLMTIANATTKSFTWIGDLAENSRAKILAQVQSIKVIRTKNGENMAFLQVTDTKKKLDVTLFPATYKLLANRIKEKAIYFLTGRIQERDGRLQMILSEAIEASSERFWIQLENHEHDIQIAEILQRFPGSIPVVLHYEIDGKTIAAPHFQVEKSKDLQEDLQKFTMKTIYR